MSRKTKSPLAALFKKEWRQHQIILSFLFLFEAIIFFIILLSFKSDDFNLSPFEGASFFILYITPVSGIVLGHRLMVMEYQAMTHIFIESLPISRLGMLFVKFTFGFLIISTINLMVILLIAAYAHQSEPVTLQFTVTICLRMICTGFALWSLFFTMGLLGKLRIPAFILLIGGLMTVDAYTSFEFSKSAPIRLVMTDAFISDRTLIPYKTMLQCIGYGSFWLVLALVLTFIREGSITETLSKRMTQREKMTFFVIFTLILVVITTLDEKKKNNKNFRFTSLEVIFSEIEPLQIMHANASLKESANKLLAHIENRMANIRENLEIPYDLVIELDPNIKHDLNIHIAQNDFLDGKTFETATMEEMDGILIRANFSGTKSFNMDAFTAYYIREILNHTTFGRARFEPRRWIYEGFSHYWAIHNLPEKEHKHQQFLLKSLMLIRQTPVDARSFKNWLLLKERYGSSLTEALAYSAIHYMEETLGRKAAFRLMRSVFTRIPYEDTRETIYEFFNPMEKTFYEAANQSFEEFISDFNNWMTARLDDKKINKRLSTLPKISGTANSYLSKNSFHGIEYQFNIGKGIHPSSTYFCALLHTKISAFDQEILPNKLLREEHLINKNNTGKTYDFNGHYGSGDRVFLALECDIPEIDSPIRLFSKRISLP